METVCIFSVCMYVFMHVCVFVRACVGVCISVFVRVGENSARDRGEKSNRRERKRNPEKVPISQVTLFALLQSIFYSF